MARYAMVWALVALGCDGAAQPPAETVPEPTQPLREGLDPPPPGAPARVANYRIDALLDAEAHRVSGHLTLRWRNDSGRPAGTLPFHLYMNGFRAPDTAFMEQSSGKLRGQGQHRTDGSWGYIDVRAVKRRPPGGGEAQPVAFAEDPEPSTMTVRLDQPVPPGGTVELDIDFETQLPRVYARTGYADDFHMVGQWFPKIGVLEDGAGWKAHTFTANSEFYADFGDYEVSLDVPSDMVVGATGILVDETPRGDRKVLRYRAELVHDFAWTAWPSFVEQFADLDGIRVRQLLVPERAHNAAIHLEAQRMALRSMEARFGPYPWSTITMVHVPKNASGAGGMEYPTLYTTSAVADLPFPLNLFLQERYSGRFTTVHEFGHQYFQGMLASNEFEQPWLDEGLNSFSNELAYWDHYGEDPWLVRIAGNEVRSRDMMRLSVAQSMDLNPIDQSAAEFHPEIGAYGAVTYNKTSAALFTLRSLVGPDAFDAAMGHYTRAFRFKHPTGRDLVEHLSGSITEQLGDPTPVLGTGQTVDVAGFLERALKTTDILDYAVASIRHRPIPKARGWVRNDAGELEGGDPPGPAVPVEELPDDDVRSVVVIHRKGGFVVPIEVEVEFADGSTERRSWDGEGRHTMLTWPGQRVIRATVDPDGRLALEGHRTNNNGYATGHRPDPGLGERVGDLGEALDLVVMGGLGP